MTTNVFDSCAGMIATDSRWSNQRGRWLFYVDDTNFHKIEVFKSIAFMFAGDGWLIHLWKEWIRTSPQDRSGQPPVNGITLSGIDISTKQVGFSEGVSILRANAIFAGSGARYACQCWEENQNAMRSVETAKQFDTATGGSVKFFDLVAGTNNLNNDNLFKASTIFEVNHLLNKEGIIMDMSNKMYGGAPFKVSDLAAMGASSELQELKIDIERKPLKAEAPTDGMYSEWTLEAKSRLDSFLSGVFGWK